MHPLNPAQQPGGGGEALSHTDVALAVGGGNNTPEPGGGKEEIPLWYRKKSHMCSLNMGRESGHEGGGGRE